MTERRLIFGILLATGLVYANSFPGAFHYDDFPLMLENPSVTAPDFRYLGFLEHYGGRPLTLWTFHWNHWLAGRDPLSYHAVNVLVHGLAAVAFFLAVRCLLKHGAGVRPPIGTDRREINAGAFVAALIFAVHPLQTQTVNYIWSRSVLLMALFGLLAMVFVRRRPWTALALFQLAVWSRTEGVVFAVPLLWLAPRRRLSMGLLTGANLAAFAAGLARSSPREMGWTHSDPWGYWSSQPAILWKYVSLMVWPAGQTVDHDVVGFPFWTAVPAALAWAAVGALAWKARRGFAAGFLGWAWVTIFLAPSAVIPNSDLFNESRAYAALGGFALAGGAAFAKWAEVRRPGAFPPIGSRSLSRAGAWMATGLFLLPMAGLTLARNQVWNDDVRLWLEAVQRSPGKARAHYNLGFALAQRGEVELAETAFLRARDLNPEDDLSYAALGYCAEVQDRMEAASEYYRRALDLRPDNAYAREGAARAGFGSGPRKTESERESDPPIRPMGVRP